MSWLRSRRRELAVCALNDPAIEARINALEERKIPCVTFNSDLPGSRRLCFVGQEMNKAGRIAGELMSRCVPPGEGWCWRRWETGALTATGQRLEGFCSRMEERGFRPEQILTAETFNDYETTCIVVAEMLRDYPELAGIYMANLNVSGCAEAVRGRGKKRRDTGDLPRHQ